jgi:molybdate transport system ATP-binding protein
MADPSQIEARFEVVYGGFSLRVDVSLPGRGVTALFGPSGCGKTTFLRCVAGLIRSPKGKLRVNGTTWQDEAARAFVPTHQRSLGMVFQDPSLFAHLSVRQNLEYGMKRARKQGARELDAVVELLNIGPLLARRPAHLSGGEQQRVAIARALLVGPELLLLDEPLASLDVQRKLEILPYLERLHDELSIPMLYVSHSPDEVARLADHLIVLDAGRVIAEGDLAETLARLDLPTAYADDAGSVIEGVIGAEDDEYHLTRVDFAGGSVWVARIARGLGSRQRIRVHARDVSITLVPSAQTSILNVLPATLEAIVDDGPERVNLRLRLGGASTPLLARITRRSRAALALRPGMSVYAQIKGVALK